MSSEQQKKLFLLGVNFLNSGNLDESEKVFKKILNLEPSNLESKTLLGIIYIQKSKYLEGIDLLEDSLKKDPNQFFAHNALGVGYLNMHQPNKAIQSFTRAIAIKKDYFDAYFNLANALKANNNFIDAIKNLDKCAALNPNNSDVYNNRGNIYAENLKDFHRGLDDYQKAIEISPKSWRAFNNIGLALKKLNLFEDSLKNFKIANKLNPDNSEIILNIAELYSYDFKYIEALKYYKQAYLLNYEKGYSYGKFLHAKMMLCDWDKFYDHLEQIKTKIKQKKIVIDPADAISKFDDPKILREISDLYMAKEFKQVNDLKKYNKHKKIKVAYCSSDFHEHPVARQVAELIEIHNRDSFEIFGFSFGPKTEDEYSQRLEKSFDALYEFENKSDLEIISFAHSIELDIAIDLNGHTRGARSNIFAMRLAPIQISYIGYLGTMGGDFYDYLLADKIMIPHENRQYYAEKIIFLPCYQVNDSKQRISTKKFLKTDFGINKNSFVFCCFNNAYKILPDVFSSWIRILNGVKNSVLMLYANNEIIKNNIIKEALLRGFDQNRIIFCERLPIPEHLARYSIADLFLDTYPYNAGTTASDALRSGLPLLTLSGNSFSSRFSASILSALDLSELITDTRAQYENLAIELANNPSKLNSIRNKLSNNIKNSSLYNPKIFANNLESAFLKIYDSYRNDVSFDDVYIN